MTVTTTHEGHHRFTAPARLSAKVPDRLARCDAVESKVLFIQRLGSQKTTRNFT